MLLESLDTEGDDLTEIRLFAKGCCASAKLSASRFRTRASKGSNVGDKVEESPIAYRRPAWLEYCCSMAGGTSANGSIGAGGGSKARVLG